MSIHINITLSLILLFLITIGLDIPIWIVFIVSLIECIISSIIKTYQNN